MKHVRSSSPLASLTFVRCTLRLLVVPLVFAVGCGDDDSTTDPATDAGVVSDTGGGGDTGGPMDMGADAGVVDTGSADTGSTDSGYYCLEGTSVELDGVEVEVPAATGTPSTVDGASVNLRCIDREVRPFDMLRSLCFTQCLDLFGFEPTLDQILELEVAVFEAESFDRVPVDPTYDPVTGADRDPDRRLDVGAVINPTMAMECDSGFQLELGYARDGNDQLLSEQKYVFRVRSRATVSQTWVDLYIWDYLRRTDQVISVGSACGGNETRIPEQADRFPVVSTSVLESHITELGLNVPGGDDLFDQQGAGHALIDNRDCTEAGSATTNMSIGIAPTPAGSAFVEADRASLSDGNLTTESGLFWALGIGSDASGTDTIDARAAVGVNRGEVCTEVMYGTDFPVFPDSITVVRTDREDTVQPL